MQTCLFCDHDRDNRMITDGKDYICGTCVQLLMTVDQDKLQKAYALAVTKGKDRKAQALEKFLKEVRYVGTGADNDRAASVGISDDDRGRSGQGSQRAALDYSESAVRRGDSVRSGVQGAADLSRSFSSRLAQGEGVTGMDAGYTGNNADSMPTPSGVTPDSLK